MIKEDLFEFYNLMGALPEEVRCICYRNLLFGADFTTQEAYGQNETSTLYFYKEGNPYVYAETRLSDMSLMPMILQFDTLVKYYKLTTDDVRSIGVSINQSGLRVPKFKAVELYYYVLKDAGTEVPEGYVIDHISHNRGINIACELRPATPQQNAMNSKFYTKDDAGEFAYDALRDYENSFYIPFLHYIMGIISFDDMAVLRGLELGTIK